MDTEDDIARALQTMETKDDFDAFLALLLLDLEENSEFWQNQDLFDFIGGLAAYARTPGGYLQDEGVAIDVAKPSWRLFADMLCGARSFDANG